MLRIKPVFRRIKCLGRIALGREAFYRREIFRDCRALGHHGAQFAVIPELLNPESAVDSFGIGTDISFELELIRASADGGGGRRGANGDGSGPPHRYDHEGTGPRLN